MLDVLKRSRKRGKNRPFELESGRACAFWCVVEKCSHETANNILFAWRIVLEGASNASTPPMWRVE